MGDVLTSGPSGFIPVWSGYRVPALDPSPVTHLPWYRPGDGETGTQVRLRSISQVGRAVRGGYTCKAPLSQKMQELEERPLEPLWAGSGSHNGAGQV